MGIVTLNDMMYYWGVDESFQMRRIDVKMIGRVSASVEKVQKLKPKYCSGLQLNVSNVIRDISYEKLCCAARVVLARNT